MSGEETPSLNYVLAKFQHLQLMNRGALPVVVHNETTGALYRIQDVREVDGRVHITIQE